MMAHSEEETEQVFFFYFIFYLLLLNDLTCVVLAVPASNKLHYFQETDQNIADVVMHAK